MTAIETLLSQRIQLFCFDFSGNRFLVCNNCEGCGLSEGDYISLGYYEREDLDCVINYLRGCDKVSTIGLWGRSMGGISKSPIYQLNLQQFLPNISLKSLK